MSRYNELFSSIKEFYISTYDQRGIALPLVLMLLIVLSILGTAAWTASQSSLKQAAILNPQLQAKYLARSAVDATISAWTEEWYADPNNVTTSAHFYTRYDDSTNEFVKSNASESTKDKFIETTQTYDSSTGICTIISKATVKGKTAQVQAISEPVYSVTSTPSLWVKNDTIQPNLDPNYNYSKRKNGVNYYSSYHYSDGVVFVNTSKSNNPLYLDKDTRYNDHRVNLIGYQAKKIIYNCPVNLYDRTMHWIPVIPGYDRVYAHIVTAEQIWFMKNITIGDGRYGTLILNLPEGKGIPGQIVYQKVKNNKDVRDKVDLDARYGIVRFAGVTVLGSFFDSENDDDNIRGRTFYFREPDGEDVLIIGMEPHTLSEAADWLGITNTGRDFRLQKLLQKGLLIPAPSNAGDLAEDELLIRFTYE